MGRSHSVSVLLVSALLLLLLSFSNGFGRKSMQTVEDEENPTVLLEENGGLSREVIELDYVEAGPNTNTKAGFIPSNLPPPAPSPEG